MIRFGDFFSKNLEQNVSCEAGFGEKRQLDWEPHVTLGSIWVVLFFFWTAVQCGKFVPADALQFPMF